MYVSGRVSVCAYIRVTCVHVVRLAHMCAHVTCVCAHVQCSLTQSRSPRLPLTRVVPRGKPRLEERRRMACVGRPPLGCRTPAGRAALQLLGGWGWAQGSRPQRRSEPCLPERWSLRPASRPPVFLRPPFLASSLQSKPVVNFSPAVVRQPSKLNITHGDERPLGSAGPGGGPARGRAGGAANARPRLWSPAWGICGAAGCGAGRRGGQPAPVPGTRQPLAPPFEVACLLNPHAAAGVGRTVGSGSLGSAGRGAQGPKRGLG